MSILDKIRISLKKTFIPVSLLVLLFLLSLGFFLLTPCKTEQKMFFFPVNDYSELGSEIRQIPYKDKEQSVSLLIREIVLGPTVLELVPIVPRGTKVNAVILRNNICYIDFSKEVLDLNNKMPYPFEKMEGVIRRNLSFNYGIEAVFFTIEGQVPGHAYFTMNNEKNALD